MKIYHSFDENSKLKHTSKKKKNNINFRRFLIIDISNTIDLVVRFSNFEFDPFFFVVILRENVRCHHHPKPVVLRNTQNFYTSLRNYLIRVLRTDNFENVRQYVSERKNEKISCVLRVRVDEVKLLSESFNR